MVNLDALEPNDLVGCRYRSLLRRRFPDTPPTEASAARRARLELTRQHVLSLFPTHPAIGDARRFIRIDIPAESDDERFFATLEALAANATFITNARLIWDSPHGEIATDLDALVQRQDGSYMPVLITNHRVARKDTDRSLQVIASRRLGLSTPITEQFRLKHHAVDSYTLAIAARSLDDLGVGCARGALIGQDHTRCFVVNTDLFQQGFEQALQVVIPEAPHRVKECASCRFWQHCSQELQASDDISLLFSGEKGAHYKTQGFSTIAALAASPGTDEDRMLARAFAAGHGVIRRQANVSAPIFDVEIDIDVEAYLDQGAYLWGAYDGQDYVPFVTWQQLGGREEAENFAKFYSWLRGRIQAAEDQGLSVGVFCYSAHGENHWLRTSARRFYTRWHEEIPQLPSEAEITEFIASSRWIDVFELVRRQLLGTHGLGLKVVAPIAGASWEVADLDGEGSVNLYLEAIGQHHSNNAAASSHAQARARQDASQPLPAEMQAARDALLSYNGDDCRATAAVRHFLAAGAPGVPLGASTPDCS